jgi:putative glycosyltransferase (TIGR04348 family)
VISPEHTLLIVHPAPGRSRSGNRVTALRWASHLRALGWHVALESTWSGRHCAALIVLHARQGHDSVRRYRARHPDRPCIVAGTGTDLYTDVPDQGEVAESLALASAVIVLQPLALEALPEAVRAKARVIHQSIPRPALRHRPRQDSFEVCLLAHLRPVKDPWLAARAARLLPPSSRLRIVHLGAASDSCAAEEAEREGSTNPRYVWLGDRPRSEALGMLARSRLLVSTSRHEGGANALTEAFAYEIPVLATAIPGSIGLLGADHPGLFPVGDERALAELFTRCESDPTFLAALRERSRALAWMTDPELERGAWRALLAEALGSAHRRTHE